VTEAGTAVRVGLGSKLVNFHVDPGTGEVRSAPPAIGAPAHNETSCRWFAEDPRSCAPVAQAAACPFLATPPCVAVADASRRCLASGHEYPTDQGPLRGDRGCGAFYRRSGDGTACRCYGSAPSAPTGSPGFHFHWQDEDGDDSDFPSQFERGERPEDVARCPLPHRVPFLEKRHPDSRRRPQDLSASAGRYLYVQHPGPGTSRQQPGTDHGDREGIRDLGQRRDEELLRQDVAGL